MRQQNCRLCAQNDQLGSTVVEVAVLIPIAMLIVLFAVQVCIWAHAATLVQNAASQGIEVATQAGSSPAAGVSDAQSLLAETAGQIVTGASVEESRQAGDVVQIQIVGHAVSILPGIHFPVSAVRVGEIQEFRESG